jgi:hypothetical protein
VKVGEKSDELRGVQRLQLTMRHEKKRFTVTICKDLFKYFAPDNWLIYKKSGRPLFVQAVAKFL